MPTEWNKKQLAINYDAGRPLDGEVIIRLFLQISNRVPLDNRTLLDAGCGTGRISIPLCKAFPSLKVVGIDISGDMIEVLKTRISSQRITNFKVLRSNLLEINYKDNFFDFSLISSVLHSIPDWKQVIKEVIRVTKKGGYLFLMSEQGDIYDIGLERVQSRGINLLEKFWGRYVALRYKYGMGSPERSQVGLKWELGEPTLTSYLEKEGYVESKSSINIKWRKEFSIEESLGIIENRCWSSMFTEDSKKFDKLVRDMKGWVKENNISMQDAYFSDFTMNCAIIKLR